MRGICEVLPSMSDRTTERLDRALAKTQLRDDLAQQGELLAQRDALLALVGEVA
jgi:beta-N-acetylhexosaminidase